MKKIIIVIMTMLFCFPAFAGCATMDKGKSEDYINYISFSPDGKKILFDRKKDDKSYMVHVYDLETGILSAYQPPDNERWSMARYSNDGKKIVFSIIPRSEKKLQLDKMQLAIMDPDGKNVIKITNSPNPKIYPSFSHSGKKVIYVRAGKIRDEGKTPAADYDVYEIDLETGKEIRLTWFKFFMMSASFYFPDDESIIFSAFSTPSIFPGVAENDSETIRKKQAELDAKSLQSFKRLGDNIYIIKKGQKELPEPLIKSKDGLRNPLLTKDGTILFSSWAYKPDGRGEGEQFFQYLSNGKNRRITNMKNHQIMSAAISLKGDFIAVTMINKILINRIQDGTSKEISLPDQPSRIINQ